jgi:hypothetical protein
MDADEQPGGPLTDAQRTGSLITVNPEKPWSVGVRGELEADGVTVKDSQRDQ